MTEVFGVALDSERQLHVDHSPKPLVVISSTRTTPNPSSTTPETVECFQWAWDLRWKHKVMPTPEDEEAMGVSGEFSFITGRVAMKRGLNDVAFRYDEAIEDNFPWGVYPVPIGPEGRWAFGGNSGWFIPTGSRYPDMAYELIRYVLSNPELLPTTGTMGSTFVGRKSFAEWGLPQGELAEAMPNYQNVFVDIPAQNQATFPWWAGYPGVGTALDQVDRSHLVEGQPNVEEALLGSARGDQQVLCRRALGWTASIVAILWGRRGLAPPALMMATANGSPYS